MLKPALLNFFKQHSALDNEKEYAIAVSGGPDSMALSHALITNYPAIKFHVLTIDHGLRPESNSEAQRVGQAFAPYQNVTHHILKWQGDKPDNAVMEAARHARYELLYQHCSAQNINAIFIAHHREDQAETFLIRLAKGSGLDGLSAMKALVKQNDIYLARPFLDLSKVDLIEYCDQHKIDYITDPSNENAKYLRPRLRQSKKILEREGLTDKRLCVTAKRLSRAVVALTYYVTQLSDEIVIDQNAHITHLDFHGFYTAPQEISLRLLQNLIESHRTGYDYGVRMEKLEDLFEALISNPADFKPRTLGGCRIGVKYYASKNNRTLLVIEKEKDKKQE